jgi:integrase
LLHGTISYFEATRNGKGAITIMPQYKKKITKLMDYPEFKAGLDRLTLFELPSNERAFLSLLFFTGCRISEALALTSTDISCSEDMISVSIMRLKGSKQTDPLELPRVDALRWLCEQKGELFPFSRYTGDRIIKKVFPNLYAHYFRMNRITKIANKFSDAVVYHLFGISATSIDHYRAKVDIKKVSQALREEVQ